MIPSPELLFGAAAIADVRPSPDGTRLAYLAPVDGTPVPWVAAVDGSDARPLGALPGLTAPRWAADGTSLLCLKDGGGDELHHLWSVDVETGRLRDLTPYEGVQAQLVGVSRDRPREVAVALNLDGQASHDLYLLSLDDAALSAPLARGATRYVVDAALRPRLAVRLRPDGAAELVTGEERVLDVVAAADTVPLILGQVAVSSDGRAGYVLTPAGGATVALVRYDLDTGRQTVLHRDDEFDVAGFSVDPSTGEVDSVCVDGARRTWHGGAVAALADPASDVVDVWRCNDDSTWVVRRVADATPAHYDVVVRDTGAVRRLSERPDLAGVPLGRTEELSFRARDGLLVRGYVTRPPGPVAPGLPAVLWVHGGPWARDRWGFDPVVQLLATRGYAVVQVNYRGSTGYGKAFLDAGDRQWGAAMQADLADAVDHLASRGAVDPRRVAIAGGSYGGYATLMGLVTEPERYACGIAWCAPSNLITLLQSFPPYWAALLAHWHARVGHPERDADLLWERSPLAHLERLRAPLLLVHGANDPRVRASESRAVRDALAARGVACAFHEVPDEGHGFTKPENNVWLLGVIAEFLQQHLPPAAP